VADARWRPALQAVLRRPELLSLHAQPIAELTTGAVAGYEALSRFDASRIAATPDRWFAAAEHWGVNAELQSRVLGLGLRMRAVLPPDTFLTVNVDPHLLTDERVSGVLLDQADLSRLVVELTEHTLAQDPVQLTGVLDGLRSRGAMIAMDDAGTGYAGLSQLLALRPDIVKLDRELISGIDVDPVRRALAEVLGDLVGRMDGWVLAEGVETRGSWTPWCPSAWRSGRAGRSPTRRRSCCASSTRPSSRASAREPAGTASRRRSSASSATPAPAPTPPTATSCSATTAACGPCAGAARRRRTRCAGPRPSSWPRRPRCPRSPAGPPRATPPT
jgi:EAL domain-containing protein (putative c-di-GMP-specific phosphodiesterase class I)